jgi:hypothetical protein
MANRIVWLTMLCAGLLLAGGGWIVAYQCFVWLRTGEWLPFEVSRLGEYFGWRQPSFGSGGVQQIFDGFQALPLNITLLGAGLTLGYLGMTVVMIFDAHRHPTSSGLHR